MDNNQINVTTSENKVNTNVTHDLTRHYSDLSKEWAVKTDGLVDNTDYSAKYYAQESKKQADIAADMKEEVAGNADDALSNIKSAKADALAEMINQEVTSKNNVIEESNTQIELIRTEGSAQIADIKDNGTTQINSIKSEGSTQVSNVTTAGTTQVTNVNNAGSTQVNNVNAAGTTQVNLAKNQVTLATNQANIATNQADLAKQYADSIDFDINRVNTSKMYTTGSVSTDEQGVEQLKSMKRSTFDKSKFEVVGSPAITDDGVVSGLSDSDYIKVPFNYYTNKLKIVIKFYWDGVTSFDRKALWRLPYNTWSNVLVGASSNRIAFYLAVGSSSTSVKNFVYTIPSAGNYTISIEFTGTQYIFKVYNEAELAYTDTFTSTENFYYNATTSRKMSIGGNNDYGWWIDSIDLKQFSITVDGKEVFSGNKTGIDTIKPDNYTVIGSPVISADGVASGFSSGNYLYVPFTQDISSYIIKGSFNCKLSSSTQGVIGLADTRINSDVVLSLRILSGNTLQLIAREGDTLGTGGITKTIPFNQYDTNIDFEIMVTPTRIKLYLNNIDSITLEGSFRTIFNEIYLGCGSRNWGLLTNGSIDLNVFKIYVDGNLVYQPCLKIPYTESKTGSKIVDEIYRNRVIDLYEQEGQAAYYTIQEDTKENFTVVGNPIITDRIASGFSYENYIYTNVDLTDKSFILETPLFEYSDRTTSASERQYIFSYGAYGNGLFLAANINESNNLICTVYNDATSLIYAYMQPVLGETYQLKYVINTSEISIYIRTSSSDYNLLYTVENASLYTVSRKILYIGTEPAPSTKVFKGHINLNTLKIYVGNELVYTPYTEPNLTLPMGEIYGMIESNSKLIETNSELLNEKLDAYIYNTNPRINSIYLKTTYINSTSGYRIWSDGYCEQWGFVPSTLNNDNSTITFLKNFSDTNYIIVVTALDSEGIGYAETKTTSTVNINVSGGNKNRNWKACGYLAEGEY